MQDVSPLSNTVGSVLDPVVSLRRTFALAPNETLRVAFVLGATESRDAASALIEKHRDIRMIDRCFELSRKQSEAALRKLGATETEVQIYAQLASALVYANPARRADTNVLPPHRHCHTRLRCYLPPGNIPRHLLP